MHAKCAPIQKVCAQVQGFSVLLLVYVRRDRFQRDFDIITPEFTPKGLQMANVINFSARKKIVFFQRIRTENVGTESLPIV